MIHLLQPAAFTRVLVALAALLVASSLLAQPASRYPAIGIYADYQQSFIQGEPVDPTCAPSLGNGSGPGFAAGALYQIPLSARFALQLRAGYSMMSGTLKSNENIGNAVENGKVVDAIVEHSLDAKFGTISFEPMVSWYPFSFPLAINVGAQVGARLSETFKQRETLVAPLSATFTGGQVVRNQSEGNIPVNYKLFGATITGLSYDIPVGERLTLAPEIAYHLDFGEIFQGANWQTNALRIGASLKMRLGGPSSSALADNRPALSAVATATGLFADSSERPIVQVRVEEFLSTQLRPLLNYVFFPDNSATLPTRYTQLAPDQARAFSVDNLHYLDALGIYHQVLNIIGRRMQENPTATITLVGTNSDEGVEKGKSDLSQHRAEAVRNYLRDNWSIPESRMKIETRGLPDKPSNINEPDGVAENRRVEIYSDTWKIVEPVVTNDTLRTATPPGIRFRAAAQAEAGAASWRLMASQSGGTLKEFAGSGAVPPVLDWHLEEDQAHVPRIPIPIDYQIEVTDQTGQVYTMPTASIPTEQVTIQKKRRERIADKEINRYSLILFDFGKSDISDANRRIIDYIKNKISLDAKVSINGYTDRLGDAEFNRKLSQDRASATAQGLGVPAANASGAGETMLFDNDLPEGRFYCRTVNVVVETPVVE